MINPPLPLPGGDNYSEILAISLDPKVRLSSPDQQKGHNLNLGFGKIVQPATDR
jgi:hypothetical protein